MKPLAISVCWSCRALLPHKRFFIWRVSDERGSGYNGAATGSCDFCGSQQIVIAPVMYVSWWVRP